MCMLTLVTPAILYPLGVWKSWGHGISWSRFHERPRESKFTTRLTPASSRTNALINAGNLELPPKLNGKIEFCRKIKDTKLQSFAIKGQFLRWGLNLRKGTPTLSPRWVFHQIRTVFAQTFAVWKKCKIWTGVNSTARITKALSGGSWKHSMNSSASASTRIDDIVF